LVFGVTAGALPLDASHQDTVANSARVVGANSPTPASAHGPMDRPLRILASNPRYFTDGSGKAVFLAGCHTWENMLEMGYSDPPLGI
jgi:hypothetical protein